MRWIWAILSLVVVAGALALLWPEPSVTAPPADERARSLGAAASETNLHSPVASAGETSPPPAATTRSAPPVTVAPSASFQPERMPDGTLRLDGRFAVPGSGSEQDPFVLTWPLLASASDAIDAAAGRLVPPPHIGFLAGQWVQISAFLAPPLWGETTGELLVMKNRWDGCCIGLPPTPFDCIEATLATPITLGARHSISFGTVRGRLVVEPFTAGSFLIGLYRLESAQVEEMKAR